MNAARDTPALFYAAKACIIKDCIGQYCAVRTRIVKACIGATSPVGEILWRATNCKTQLIRAVLNLKFKAEF